jgi:hypothetical protein
VPFTMYTHPAAGQVVGAAAKATADVMVGVEVSRHVPLTAIAASTMLDIRDAR